LNEVLLRLGQDSTEAADRVAQAVILACDLLCDSPLVNNCVVYHLETKPLQIIPIRHGERNWRPAFDRKTRSGLLFASRAHQWSLAFYGAFRRSLYE
jgi:hypothetical protein